MDNYGKLEEEPPPSYSVVIGVTPYPPAGANPYPPAGAAPYPPAAHVVPQNPVITRIFFFNQDKALSLSDLIFILRLNNSCYNVPMIAMQRMFVIIEILLTSSSV